jgi:hypothetical protein
LVRGRSPLIELHDLEAHIFRQEQAAAVRKAVDALSPRERDVIIARFGLDGAACTLDDTALELAKRDGYTVGRERVRQIERKALRHLAKPTTGLHEVADIKPPKTFNVAEFEAHHRARKAQRERAEQWRAQRAADERAAQARRDAEAFAAQQRAARKPWAEQAVAGCSPWSNPPATPSNHYDWMQRIDDLARWRAGGRPINPFDWMKS